MIQEKLVNRYFVESFTGFLSLLFLLFIMALTDDLIAIKKVIIVPGLRFYLDYSKL
jgi:hypothetical protein